jgi:hypothetical protein
MLSLSDIISTPWPTAQKTTKSPEEDEKKEVEETKEAKEEQVKEKTVIDQDVKLDHVLPFLDINDLSFLEGKALAIIMY